MVDHSLCKLSSLRGHSNEEVKSNVTGVYSDVLDSESSHNRSGDLAERG